MGKGARQRQVARRARPAALRAIAECLQALRVPGPPLSDAQAAALDRELAMAPYAKPRQRELELCTDMPVPLPPVE